MTDPPAAAGRPSGIRYLGSCIEMLVSSTLGLLAASVLAMNALAP